MEGEFVTVEEFQKFRRAVIKKLKRQDDLISDAFAKIAEVEAHGLEMQDEAVDRAARAERAVRRLKKEVDAWE
jgi:hypothetical protein